MVSAPDSQLSTPFHVLRFLMNRLHSAHEYVGNRCRSQRGWQFETTLAVTGMAKVRAHACAAVGDGGCLDQAEAGDPNRHAGDAGETRSSFRSHPGDGRAEGCDS